MNIVSRALEFATKKHHGQVRKDGTPYIQHPIRVMANIVQFQPEIVGTKLMAAALLHDTIEDTDCSYDEIRKEFGSIVADLVVGCTNDDQEIKRIGKKNYLKEKMLYMSPATLTVKLADRLDNISYLKPFPVDKIKTKIESTEEIMHFIKTGRNLDEIHLNAIKQIEDKISETKRSFRIE